MTVCLRMAESSDPFARLKEQVTCSVCLGIFTQPKLLACTHAFCMSCINLLPVNLVDGDRKIKCPTCREPTTLPKDGSTASLRPAFHISILIELYHTAVKLPVAVNVADRPKYDKCPKHDRPLEMYCDDCQEIQCAKCFSADHRDHNCDFISDVIDKHQQEINDQLQPVKQKLNLVLDALHDLDTQQEHIATHAESVKSQIDALIDLLVQAICQSGATLKQNVDTLVQHKLNNISQKKEEGEIFLTLLKSCEQHVQDKLCNGSQQEILLEKNEMMENLRAVSQQLTLQMQQLQLKEKADIVFQQSCDILEKCSKIGEVSTEGVDIDMSMPNSCSITDEVALQANTPPSVEDPSSTVSSTTNKARQRTSQYKPHIKLTSSIVAVVDKPRDMHIQVPSVSWLKRNALSCHLVADAGGVSTQCEIKHVEKEKYHISFTATCEGLHHVHVKVQCKGAQIPCDPCTIQAVSSNAVYHPTAIALAPSGLLVVAGETDITVMDKEGCIIGIANSQGSGSNRGICIAPDNHILVTRSRAPHVIKYTMDCIIVSTANTSQGNDPLQFKRPLGIAVSTSGHVYICDTHNYRIQVLNPDLTFSHVFGEEGSGPGQFKSPCGIVIDSQDIIYVCDCSNNRIQKFSSNGTYISEFEVPPRPRYIALDCNLLYITTRDTVAVYNTDGKAIHEKLMLPNSDYQGVAVDQDHIFVCDYSNDQIITF